ncbi:TRAP transporter substrate-binding protein [Rhizobium helianthi]|uniref:TRAP transporter substrate-binding protein n=1 Tax=Rhizobium helianthi TaxID=1132695 RepID=A0ABW4M0L9_9HYPH
MISANRRAFLKVAAGASLALPSLLGSAHARATQVTVASLLGEDKPETKIWRHIQEQVEAQLPGRFRFNIVTNGALGGEKQVAEASRLGAVQASLSTVSALSGWVPELQLLDLPFLFRDAEHLRRVVSGDTGISLQEKLRVQSFVASGFIDYGARHLLTKEPVTTPQDIRGKRIRVIQSPLHTKLWSAYGAAPVGIPITETYNALSTGVADAMDLTKSAYTGFKLYEVVPCMTETAHIRASGVVYFSALFWNSLGEEERGVLSAAAQSGARYFNQLVHEDEVRSVEVARQNGGQLLQPLDMDTWREGATSVWQDFAAIVGGMDKIHAVVEA